MKFNKNLFLKLPFQLRPFRVGLVYMISIIVTILFFIEIRLSEHFIDSVLGDVESVLFGSSIFILALVVIIKFIQFFLSSVARFTLIDIENEIKTYFEEKILGKYTRLKYELLRNKQIQENKHTLNKLGERSWQFTKRTSETIIVVLKIISVLLFAGVHNIDLIIATVLFSAIIVTVHYYSANRSFKLQKYIDKKEVEIQFERIHLSSVEYFAEKKMYSLSDNFLQRNALLNNKMRNTILKNDIFLNCIRFLSGDMVRWLYFGIIFLLLYGNLVNDKISIGFFIVMLTASSNIIDNVKIIGEMLMQSKKDLFYIRSFLEFMALDEKIGIYETLVHDLEFESLRLENVSFRYPNTDTFVLKNLSLEIKKGFHYAIVGENGVGKSTLIKLITGMYDATEGNIYINNNNIKNMPQNEINSFICCINQDFLKYNLSIKENIAISDIEKIDISVIERVAKQAGILDFILNLPKKFDTIVGKLESGAKDMSGGQWQKIALARLLYSKSPLKVLDEPTASMDPISESILYKNYHNILGNHSSIMISHRLGATKIADKIFVLKDGRIFEEGTHQELMMIEEGYYKTLFLIQRELYK